MDLKALVQAPVETAIESSLNFRIVRHDLKFPPHVFGVFVGIERSAHDTLPYFPFKVHGCIGYWEEQYQALSDEEISSHLVQVAKEAAQKDQRRQSFTRSLYVDVLATYKVYLMMQPLYMVNSETGYIQGTNSIFNNEEYGLIVQNQGQRATYLPGVFSRDLPWNNLKSSLVHKAAIDSSGSSSQFLAYKCLIYSSTLLDYYALPLVQFMNRNYGQFVPYSWNSHTNEVVRDPEQDVRNIGTMLDLLQLHDLDYPVSQDVLAGIQRNVQFYLNVFPTSRQAQAFLLLVCQKMPYHKCQGQTCH